MARDTMQLAHDFLLWLETASLADIEAICGQLAVELTRRGEPGSLQLLGVQSVLQSRVAHERERHRRVFSD